MSKKDRAVHPLHYLDWGTPPDLWERARCLRGAQIAPGTVLRDSLEGETENWASSVALEYRGVPIAHYTPAYLEIIPQPRQAVRSRLNAVLWPFGLYLKGTDLFWLDGQYCDSFTTSIRLPYSFVRRH